jgi:hypothetical protein
MLVEQRSWTDAEGWQRAPGGQQPQTPQLVLFFGARAALASDAPMAALRERYPEAHVVGCSTAGEICGTEVSDGKIIATAVEFQHTHVRTACRALADAQGSFDTGHALAQDLAQPGLAHVFVLAEGLKVNGSELVEGLRRGLPSDVAVTGGLAGDGDRFQQTIVSCDGQTVDGAVAVVGFYGDRLRIGYGSMGGWDAFGPERLVTRSDGNILYELDGGSALELYKSYLGPHAKGLPSSGLLFPLSLRGDPGSPRLVRTILGVDEAQGSLIFAGDIPEGSYAQLMKANVDRLIDGAHGAAGACHEALGRTAPDLAILISCVGRKLVLKQRVEEEVESVRDVLGAAARLTGFYSYGEIAPFLTSAKCELHNQTMTITTFAES